MNAVAEETGERSSNGFAHGKSPMHQHHQHHEEEAEAADEAADDDDDEGGIDMSQIVVPTGSKSYDAHHSARESDIYSVHSEDIQESHQHEETDDELTGDGSKPVGCTSCAIM
jgi:hypothetical protein